MKRTLPFVKINYYISIMFQKPAVLEMVFIICRLR